MSFWSKWASAFALTGSCFGSSGLPAAEAGACSGAFAWHMFDPSHTSAFYQTLKISTKQTMTVMTMTVMQHQKQTFYVRWVPQGKEATGNWILRQQVIGVKMDIDIGGNKFSLDSSARAGPQSQQADFLKTLLTIERDFAVDPETMKLRKLYGDMAFNNLVKENPQTEALLRGSLSAVDECLKATLQVLPSGPIASGATWNRTVVIGLGPTGNLRTDFHFKDVGRENGRDKIQLRAQLEYVPLPGPNKLPFNIQNTSALKGTGTGYALLRLRAGWLDYYTITLAVEGHLDIEIGGMKTRVPLSQEQTVTVTTTPYDPLVGPPAPPCQPRAVYPSCGESRPGLFSRIRRVRCR